MPSAPKPLSSGVFTARFNKVRARVEHIFGVIKNLWGYRKVRYKGIHKNATQVFTLLALANLYLVRKQPRMLRA